MSDKTFRKCPVCEKDIPEGKNECPNCGVVLDLFDVELEEDIPEESMEKVMDMVLNEKEEKQVIQDIKNLGLSEEDLPEDIVEDLKQKTEEEIEEIYAYECVECGTEVSFDAKECPECGVIFEEESDQDIVLEDLEEDELKSTEFDLDESVELIDFEEDIAKFTEKINKLESDDIDLKYLKNDIERLEKFKKEGAKEKGEQLIQKLKDDLDVIKELYDHIEESKSYLNILSEKLDVADKKDELDEVYEGIKLGEYSAALKRIEDFKGEINKILVDECSDDWLENLIEEKLDKADEYITKSRSNLNITYLEEKMDESKSAKKEGDISESIKMAVDTLNSAEKALEISDKIDIAKERLEELKKKDVKIDKHSSKLEKLVDDIEGGEYEKSVKKIDDILEKLEKELEREKRIEERAEERRKKDQFKKIQRILPVVNELIDMAKELDIETKKQENLVNEALDLTKDNDYELAIDTLKSCKKSIKKKLHNEIKNKIELVKSENMEERVKNDIEKLENELKEENYKKVHKIIKDVELDINFLSDPQAKLNSKIQKLENILELAEAFEMDIKNITELMKNAKSERNSENWRSSRDLLDKTEQKMKDELIKNLKMEIKNAKAELKDAKQKGEDISEPITHLKKANQLQKNGELEESFKSLEEYYDSIEKIREKL